MNTRTLRFAVILVAVAAVGVTLRNFGVTRRVRAEIAALTARRVALEAERRQLEQRRAVHPPAAEPAVSTGTSAPVAPAVVARAEPKPPPDASTLMARNPALRELFQRYTQADLGFRYRPFYRAANLSPDMIRRFQSLMIEQQQQAMDLASASSAAGVSPEDAKRLQAEQTQRHQAEQEQLLGADAFGKYREFARIEPMEAAVASVATLGAETGEPLTEAQGERLLTILANNSASYQNGGRADIWTLDLPQLLVQAQPVLSPSQFSVLKGNAAMAEAFALARDYQIAHGEQ